MAFRVVEGAVTSLGSISGTDGTPVGLYEPTRAVRVFIENSGGHEQTIINSTAGGPGVQIVGAGTVGVTTNGFIITVSGISSNIEIPNALVGVDGITVISGTSETTISGFRDEFLSASGTLQSDVDCVISGINQVYALRLDAVGESTTYVGEASPGTSESALSWRIKRLVETGPDLVITWASGTSAFEFAWDDRLVVTYG